jgi:biotin carboxyl carrier protein
MNEFVVTVNEKKLNILFKEDFIVSIDGKEYNYYLSKLNDNSCNLIIDNKSFLVTLARNGNSEYIVTINGNVIRTRVLSAIREKAANLIVSKTAKQSVTEIKSPMPGMILKIKKSNGDKVRQGDSVMILEAMKMENDIHSQISGEIKEIKVKEGQAVEKGAVLFKIG